MAQLMIAFDAQRGQTIQERFEQFHRANPHVYEALRALAFKALDRGFEHIGIDALYSVLRWEWAAETNDPTGFKLNDHYRSRYARLLMDQEPALGGLFEIRTIKTE